MILITHDLGVVAGRCDEVAVMYAGKVVEKGPTRSLFANTRMPYTQALLDSIPRLDQPPHQRLRSIAGRPPSLIGSPSGCRFAPRCSRVTARCQSEEPYFHFDEGGVSQHGYACWHPLKPLPTTGVA